MKTTYTISHAMQQSIDAVRKHFSYGSELETSFFVEADEDMRNEYGYYDGCELHHPMDAKNKTIIVNYEGEISGCKGFFANANDLLSNF